jgi:hypothetical protein
VAVPATPGPGANNQVTSVGPALYKVPFSSVPAHLGGVAVITGELKSKIDRVWDAFWSGGISNPLEVIEQITYRPEGFTPPPHPLGVVPEHG